MRKKIHIYTNIAPHYRKPLWDKLLDSKKIECFFFYGKSKKLRIKTIDFSISNENINKGRYTLLKNIWIKNILLYQIGVIKST